MTYRAGTEEKIRIYCDADWEADLDDRHSFSGLVVKIEENVIWRCTKQKCITTSTMETEYISLSGGVKEAIWIKMFFNETKLINLVTGDVELYYIYDAENSRILFGKDLDTVAENIRADGRIESGPDCFTPGRFILPWPGI